mmetsp:Transcript_28653/g.77275  ORF Transcript_28653/g.77275 Transcript_28653/m.77275 type:complete len:196 (+) Transcript_28653:149-736(+)
MAFFGLTTLGPSNPIRENAKDVQTYPFHELSMEVYMSVFNKYLLGDSQIARTLDVDGENYILRAALGDMLRELLGRQPRKYELEAWFTFHDFDRDPIMSREQFAEGIDMLQNFSSNPKPPKQYTSYDQLRKDWLRHTRVEYNLQETCSRPSTLAQEIGWHTIKPAPRHQSFHSNHTDVTRTEGTTAKTYYGHFLC